jgi:hypothetical protein
MTEAIPITSARRDEGLAARTPVEAAFLQLLAVLDRCIASERLLLEVDPDEFDSTRAACETAGETLTRQLSELVVMPDAGPADRSLRRLAFMVQSLLSIEHDADRAFYAANLLYHVALFDARAPQPAGPTPQALHQRCLERAARLVRLRDTPTGQATPAACSPALAV